MATAEFSKVACILSEALSQHHLLGFEIAYWNSMTSTSSTRDLFKKIRDTKGTFHVKIDTLKDRNDVDLTEAEDIKKRWQDYTEGLEIPRKKIFKKDLHHQDNHDDMITHLEPDILECEVKWALGSITMNKAGRGNGIPGELF